MFFYLYCVYDKVAKEFLAPMMYKNDDVAKRVFNMTFNENPKANPMDYILYRVGKFSIDSGEITPEKVEVFVNEK